jgi:hypothetical protein
MGNCISNKISHAEEARLQENVNRPAPEAMPSEAEFGTELRRLGAKLSIDVSKAESPSAVPGSSRFARLFSPPEGRLVP